MLFEQNLGQYAADLEYCARGRGIAAGFTKRGIKVSGIIHDESGDSCNEVVTLDFFGSRPGCTPVGEKQVPGIRNYLLGDDPTKWCTNVPLFEGVRYPTIAPGIAMVVIDRDGRLEYDLHVEQGADLAEVSVTCEGAESLTLQPDGSLDLSTKAGVLRQLPIRAWYETTSGARELADCRVRITGPRTYGFEVCNPQATGTLIVDPGLVWSTYLGIDQDDVINGIDFDSGLVTVTGATQWSSSQSFPTSWNAFQQSNAGGLDAFVTRFNPSQTGTGQLVWSTLIGGTGDDEALGIAGYANGTVAIAGRTTSGDFPTVNPFQSSHPSPGNRAAFVTRLDANGISLLYSTYYGGSSQTFANAVVNTGPALQHIIITGGTYAGDLPITSNAYDQDYVATVGPGDVYVAKFDPKASGAASLVYATYVGGTGTATSNDEAFALAVEGSVIYVGGLTHSSDFQTRGAPTAWQNLIGLQDGFILSIDPTQAPATQLLYATYFGGFDVDTVLVS